MNNGLRLEKFGCHNLRDIDLELAPGQCLGLSGPSGSGKTLFLRALADLEPHRGRIWLDGTAADQVPAPQWRRQVGLLPAESAWWFDTVGPHFFETPGRWLQQLGFDDQVMQWEISRLSSGERQRLSLLRLLINRPRALLLDEPTANLDQTSMARVEALLADYRQSSQAITIWVSHDLNQLARLCHPVLVIDGRRLVPLDRRSAKPSQEIQ